MARTDYYGVLGVAREASEDEIRSAYRKLARQYHPDVNNADEASARFLPARDLSRTLLQKARAPLLTFPSGGLTLRGRIPASAGSGRERVK